MTSADLDRVFGRGRVRMVTGEHVEVFREEAAPGERRRYTKRFLCTSEGDFRHWTEREWRILARLVGHGVVAVPEVLRFERGTRGQPSMVQTYDAGITVDHWTTLLPVRRDRRVLRHVFEDCAHWWALAFHALRALDEIHALQLVHLDLKADNICLPVAPADFDPCVAGQLLRPQFDQIALIDFAFSLVSGEPLAGALPIGHQVDHGYQSPRLLHALEAGRRGDLGPTRQLDWRCDIYSLAAMLRRYLPDAVHAAAGAWTQRRLSYAHALVDRLFDAHHRPLRAERPHRALMEHAASALADEALADSLARGWALASEVMLPHVDSPTPVTRIAMPVSVAVPVVAVPAVAVPAVAVPAVGDAADAALARSGPWLRTVPLWVPAGAAAPQRVAQPARGTRRPGESVSSLAWVSGLLGLVAGGLALVLPSALGPAQRDVTSADAAWVGHAPQTDELTAALAAAHVAPDAHPPAASASTPATSASTPARVDMRVAQAVTLPSPQGEPAPSPRPDASASTAGSKGNVRAGGLDRRPAARTPARTLTATPTTPAVRPSPRAAPGESARQATALKTGRTAREPARAEATKRVARATAPTRVTRPPVAETHTAALPRAPSVPTTPPVAIPQAARETPRAAVAQVQPAPSAAEDQSPAADSQAVIISTLPSLPESAQAPLSPAVDVPAVLEDFTSRAETLIARELPRLAQRAERLVLRVLHAASISSAPGGPDAQVLNAAMAMQRMVDDTLAALSTAAADARRLHEAAATAFWGSRDPARALRLELRAFGADPRDPEVAGALAFYQLKQRPAQAEAARRLALLALALPHPGAPHGRIEDWTTFAIASALAGRERDARNAWLVTLSLGPVERQCRAAVAAYASHGAPLRASVEAMLTRVREAGRSTVSPFCRWPPNWWAAAKAD